MYTIGEILLISSVISRPISLAIYHAPTAKLVSEKKKILSLAPILGKADTCAQKLFLFFLFSSSSVCLFLLDFCCFSIFFFFYISGWSNKLDGFALQCANVWAVPYVPETVKRLEGSYLLDVDPTSRAHKNSDDDAGSAS